METDFIKPEIRGNSPIIHLKDGTVKVGNTNPISPDIWKELGDGSQIDFSDPGSQNEINLKNGKAKIERDKTTITIYKDKQQKELDKEASKTIWAAGFSQTKEQEGKNIVKPVLFLVPRQWILVVRKLKNSVRILLDLM